MPVPLIGWPTAAASNEDTNTRLVPLKPPVAVSDATVELLENVAPVTPARPPKLNVARFAPTVPTAPVTLRLRVPEPAALALPKEVVPAPEIVRPPVKVLLPETVTVLPPWRLSAKLPMTGPEKVPPVLLPMDELASKMSGPVKVMPSLRIWPKVSPVEPPESWKVLATVPAPLIQMVAPDSARTSAAEFSVVGSCNLPLPAAAPTERKPVKAERFPVR